MALAYKALERSEGTSVPAVLRIAGEPGIGKTAFLEHLVEEMARRGWLTIATGCHEIQRHTPFVTANRLVLAALRSLGNDGARYTSGLESGLAMLDSKIALLFDKPAPAAIDKNRYQEIFLRFFDGIGTDHKILIACDDAQWIDAESLDVLNAFAANAATSSVALIFAERLDAGAQSPAHSGTIVLERFDPEQSEAFALSRYPQLDAISLETLVHHGNGNAFDILTLCEELAAGSAGVSETAGDNRVRNVIANRVLSLQSDEREFLQLCSLLGDPIEYRMLFALYTPSEVAMLVSGSARPYLMPEGPALRFRHSLVAEAILTTVTFDVPLRRRIIAALQSLTEPSLADLDRLAAHALAAGDKQLALDTLYDLSSRAFTARSWTAAINACERALAISEIDSRHFVQFYTQYTMALRSDSRDELASNVLASALTKARTSGITQGVGALLSMLMASFLARAQYREAIDAYETFYPTLQSDADRADAIVLAMNTTAMAFDDAAFEAERKKLPSVDSGLSNYGRAGLHGAMAFYHSAHGEFDQAITEIEKAISFADHTRRQGDTLGFTKLLLHFRHEGCTIAENRLPGWLANNRVEGKEHDFGSIFRAWVAIAKGDWELSRQLVSESFFADDTSHVQVHQRAITAMLDSLSAAAQTEAERDGGSDILDTPEAVLQLVPWMLLRKRDRDMERRLERVVFDLPEHPPAPFSIGFVPFGVALYAQRAGKTSWLEMFAVTETFKDRSPWTTMQWTLARGIALLALKNTRASSVLAQAAAQARTLSADFFAAYAAYKAGAPRPEDLALLKRIRLADLTGARAPRHAHGLTARELQVARLVGDGKSNREIAESLVLSERTVERHLGNVFDKLHLESRVKLMRWLFENDSEQTTSY